MAGTSDTELAAANLRAFRVVIAVCVWFFTLTIAAMFVYPGGHVGDADSNVYTFFKSFFSDLGQTRTYSGASNLPLLLLFCIALFATAQGSGLFFVAFARLFPRASLARQLYRRCLRNRYRRVLHRRRLHAMECVLTRTQRFREVGVSLVSRSGTRMRP
jgi:hypothetical protein